jgi:hypothetical protein
MRLHAGDYFLPHAFAAMLKTAISAGKYMTVAELQIVAPA